jgi:Zn-dependent protease with chaperone function
LGVSNALGDLLNLAYSRHRESEADAFSLRLTRQARAFISSEVRLTNQNLGWFHPPSWLELLFYTHPAPWRRVAMGERFEARSQPQC